MEKVKLTKRFISMAIDISSIIIIFSFLKWLEDSVDIGFIGFCIALITMITLTALIPLQEYYFGQTIGKRIMKLEVIDIENKKLSLKKVYLRYFINVWDIFTLCVIRLLLMKKTGKSLAETYTNTIVINQSR